MQQALRPYVTTGIAVVGATALIAAPVAAPTSLTSVHAYEVELTAGLGDALNGAFDFLQLTTFGDPTDPVSVYSSLVTNSFTNVLGIGENWIDQPFPIAQAVIGNQIGYLTEAFSNPASIVDIPGQMFSNFGDVFDHLTSLTPTITDGGEAFLNLGIGLPVPLVMGLAAIGPLANGLGAFNGSFTAFETALNGGQYLQALGALVAGPGYVGDAMLNGSLGLDLGLNVDPSINDILGFLNLDGGVLDTILNALPSLIDPDAPIDIAGLTVDLPLLNGLLVPMDDGGVNLTVLGEELLDVTIGKFGGLTDGFVNYLPQQIADALINDSAAGSLPGIGGIFDGFDLGNILNGFDFANILSGFDATDILGTFGLAALLGEILPTTAAGLPTDLLGGFLDPGLILGMLGL